MADQTQSEGSKALDQAEHNWDANAKRVVLRAQDPGTGEFVNVGATDNGDGSYGIRTGDPTLITRLDETADPILYIGKAEIGSGTDDAAWQIAKLDTNSGLIKTWAGNAAFTQVWDDRASLTYN